MRASSTTATVAVLAGLVLAPRLVPAQPAPGDERPIVMLIDPRGPLSGSDAAQHALSRLRKAIGEIGARAPDRAALANRRDARVDASVLASAVGLRERAEQHFRRLEADRALRLLEDASILHTRRFCDVFGDPEAARAARLTAAVYSYETRPLRMREELRKAITYEPVTHMDPAQYPPDLVRDYETEREYLHAAGLPLPSPTRLCEAARLVGASAIATVAPLATTDASFGLDVYDPLTCGRRAVTLPLTGDDESARRAARAIFVPAPAEIAQTFLVRPPAPAPVRPPPAAQPPPWFARWYTLAGAGALVVGGVLTAALLFSGEPTNDLGVAREDGSSR
jgi:hypothetical protein